MRNSVRFLCLLALSATPAAGASEAPPWNSIIPDDVPATRHDLPGNAVTVGRVIQLLMQETRLTDLYERRIIPEIRHVGDAGDSVSWGCLTVATTGGPVVIRPNSDEMGANNLMTGVEVERVPKDWPSNGTNGCPTRTGSGETAVITLDDGLRFGSSKAAVIRMLGRPSLARDDLLDYRYSAPVPGCPKCEGIFGDLAFRFEREMMTALEVKQIAVGE